MIGKKGKGNDARLSLRLPAERKHTIEEAAAKLGLTVSEFSGWALVQAARKVVGCRNTTRLATRKRTRIAK
jgi:uncharacterized protein (DUF1778 family)